MNGLERFEPISLTDLIAVAPLQTRVDRKYLVTPAQLDGLIADVPPEARILDIDGRRAFAYETVYFDTAERVSYLGAAYWRPARFKVRTRTYVDSNLCQLEVKVRDRRGRTVKHRIGHDPARRRELDRAAMGYLRQFGVVVPHLTQLSPVLTTNYPRTTFMLEQTRMTVDHHVSCTAPDGRRVVLDGVMVVETKSGLQPSSFDRLLWAHGIRPRTISKFGVGLAVLEPGLPSNKWQRTIRQCVALA